ncbi:MAG: FAD-dependent monooxygenase [Deltaproteobacteria bacterium]|nr:FAD-dependent monooxygenase [Deltaproteobacteria bacterium]
MATEQLSFDAGADIEPTPVTIVGAGPTGLALAVDLRLRGVSCRIVDKNLRRTSESRALAVHARTLETLERFGVAEEAVREGRRVPRLNAYWEGEPAFSLTFPALDTAYPFVLSLPQSETERLLEERLESLGGRVERGTELVALRQGPEEVEATCRGPKGAEERLRSRWLAGCDGAHSTVRELLGLPFEGSTYEERFALADVELEWSYPEGEGHVFFFEGGPLAAFPLPGEHRYRLIGLLSESEEATGALFVERLQEARTGASRIRNLAWLSSFRVHRRIVPAFREGRIFLAGDAAHIHSPLGGQGMNTGIQDAENLSWKLAWVEQGLAREELLRTYDEERRPVALAVMKETHRATRLVTLKGGVAQRLRNRLTALLLRLPAVGHRLLRGVAELDFAYRSGIVDEHWPEGLGEGKTSAGRRAPDALGGVVRLYDHLDPLRPTLLLFRGLPGEGSAARVLDAASAVASRYGERIATVLVGAPPAPEGWGGFLFPDPEGTVHRAYAAFEDCAYLIRPDRYIGFRTRPADAGRLLAHLTRVLS